MGVWMADEWMATVEGAERVLIECGGGSSPYSGLQIVDRTVLAFTGPEPRAVWEYHWNLCLDYGLLPMVWLRPIP